MAGIDEVGRGCIAGPLLAAAFSIQDNKEFDWTPLVKDSKVLTPKQRSLLSHYLRRKQFRFGIGIVSHIEIDTLGMTLATQLAMTRSIGLLNPRPDFLLIDAVDLSKTGIPCKALIKGDATCFSIAAASIIAKVARDNLMVKLDYLYPGYDLAQNKGYPTPSHLAALQSLGPSPIHRRRFSPIKTYFEGFHG